MKVGILALQGSFAEHGVVLDKIKQPFVLVKTKQDLEGLTHLIIPGGESTTLEKLLKKSGLWEELEKKIKKKELKFFGTCAGAIIFSKLGMDLQVERNGYGAQQNSFVEKLESEMFPELGGVFIRAPRFKVQKNSKILARMGNEPVLIEQDKFLTSSFHPELIGETRVHEYFLKK